MANRVSALDGYYKIGFFGEKEKIDLKISEVRNLKLYQIAFWSNTLVEAGNEFAKTLGFERYPGQRLALAKKEVALLRIEPLKFWLINNNIPAISAEKGNVLDLSFSRTHLKFSGNNSTALLNRHLPIDLRDQSFPLNTVASTSFHHVGVTLWRSGQGYELFIPRAFVLSLWEILLESAAQFGYEIG